MLYQHLQNLLIEIIQEIGFDGFVGQIPENRKPEFAIEYSKTISISNILIKSTQVGCQCLISVILLLIYRSRCIKFWKKPVINTTHIINQLVITKRRTNSKTIGPDKSTMYTLIISYIETNNNQVISLRECWYFHLQPKQSNSRS